jgi:hypothetical protein
VLDRGPTKPDVHVAVVQWIVLIAALPLFAFGAVNVVSPRTTSAWQVRATARHRDSDPRAAVGGAFQQWVGIDPSAPPSDTALRRLRALGIAEMATAVVFVVGAFAIFS